MASNRNDNLREAIKKTYARGGLRGFYQGLIPWVRSSPVVDSGLAVWLQGEVSVGLDRKFIDWWDSLVHKFSGRGVRNGSWCQQRDCWITWRNDGWCSSSLSSYV